MINLRKIVCKIINFITCLVYIELFKLILLPFPLTEIGILIIISILTLIIFYVLSKMNHSENSIGWKISKKLILDENQTISVPNLILILMLFIPPIAYILRFIFDIIQWFILKYLLFF